MKLSVVVPCFNEEDVVPLLYDEVVRETDRVVEEWELVLVDDGSSDDTLGQCRKLADSDERVVYVSLTRNFGKESALLAGLLEGMRTPCGGRRPLRWRTVLRMSLAGRPPVV